MNRILLTTVATLTTTQAFADTGHLADQGHGHTHWLGYALLALAIAIPAGVALVRRLKKVARA